MEREVIKNEYYSCNKRNTYIRSCNIYKLKLKKVLKDIKILIIKKWPKLFQKVLKVNLHLREQIYLENLNQAIEIQDMLKQILHQVIDKN